jgi:cell division protein FtsQ
MAFASRVFIAMLCITMLCVLGVGLLYGYRWLTASPYLALKDITVSGNSRLTNGDILNLAKVKLGDNCLNTNIAEVERNISANPWVKAATVRREFPNKLVITISERVPGFWVRERGTLNFADRHGKIIAPMQPGETGALPILEYGRGMNSTDTRLSALLDMIQGPETPFDMNQVAWVKVLGSKQVEIFLDGQRLALRMDLNGWQRQFRRIKAVWRDLALRGQFAQAEMIAATGDKVWVKRRGQGTAS